MPSPFAPSDQPPIDDSFPGGDGSDQELAAPGLTLTPDQLASAGLVDLMEGDTFEVHITGTVTSADGDLTAEITGATGGKLAGGEMPEPMGELGEPEPENEMMTPGVKGPKAAGFGFKKPYDEDEE